MIVAVELPLALQDRLRVEALGAYPRESCGLIEGVLSAQAEKVESSLSQLAQITALHPMPNIAQEPDRFEIDPAAHIALLRNLRGSGRDIIGCYHSHPNGRAEPSERDCESAEENGFLWLISTVDAETRSTTTAAFVIAARGFAPVAIMHDIPGTAGACGRPPI